MLTHPQFDPIALSLGPLQIHWYGLTYLAAFSMFYLLAAQRVKRPWYAEAGWTRETIEDLLFFGVLGVILGGRLGYVLFYKPTYYLGHPGEILAVWQGGMAFHGGLIGVMVAMLVFAWRRQRSFFEVADLVAPCVPGGRARGASANSSRGGCGAGRPIPACPGPWSFRSRAATCRAIPLSSTSLAWKA